MGQTVRYVIQATDALYPMLVRDERAAMGLERQLAGVNSQIRGIASAIGIGFGLHAIVDLGKSFIQAAADFEVSMLRIKNASENATVGLKNQLFIKKEVDEFKLKLDETADSYGNFLFKMKNAAISSDVKNNLFKELLAVSKVGGLSQEQMASTLYNTSLLLGEGVLETRHLRPLTMAHPNLIPFIAEQMGLKDKEKDMFSKMLGSETDDMMANQKLSQLMSKRLTKLGLSSIDVLIPAFNKYYESIKDKVPETLNTIQSGMNEIHTQWVYFQTEIVDKLRPELASFFTSIKDGLGWMREHESGLIKVGQAIAGIVKYWLEYKAVMLAINLGTAAYNTISSLFITETVAETTATAGLNREMLLLNANLENLIRLQGMAAIGSGALTRSQVALATTTGGIPLVAAGGSSAIAGEAAAVTSIAGVVTSAIPIVFGALGIGWMLTKAAEWDTDRMRKNFNDKWEMVSDPNAPEGWKWHEKTKDAIKAADNRTFGYSVADVPMAYETDLDKQLKKKFSWVNGSAKSKTPKAIIDKAADHITGQRVITYNINIHGGVNGQKIDKQVVSSGADMDIKNITSLLAQSLESVVNDSQLHGNE